MDKLCLKLWIKWSYPQAGKKLWVIGQSYSQLIHKVRTGVEEWATGHGPPGWAIGGGARACRAGRRVPGLIWMVGPGPGPGPAPAAIGGVPRACRGRGPRPRPVWMKSPLGGSKVTARVGQGRGQVAGSED